MNAYIERVLATAVSYEGWCVEGGGNNRGQAVEAMLAGVWLSPGQPWCAAAVAHWGYRGLLNLRTKKSKWPVPRTGGCAVLGDFGKSKNILYEAPQVGDIFLLYRPELKRFGHTGLVIEVDDSTYYTVEGNTNKQLDRDGGATAGDVGGVFSWPRQVRPKDRFLRWVELLDA